MRKRGPNPLTKCQKNSEVRLAVTVTNVTLSSNGYAATATVTAPGPTYLITPSAPVFSVGSAGNYSITYVSGTLTVNPRPLTIMALNSSKPCGLGIAFFLPAFTVGATTTTPLAGLVNGDMISGISEDSDGAAATATVTSPGPNYALIPINASFLGGTAVAGAKTQVLAAQAALDWLATALSVYATTASLGGNAGHAATPCQTKKCTWRICP
jgi:hypothetical protein